MDTINRLQLRLLVVLVLCALAAVACSDGDDAPPTNTTADSPEQSTQPSRSSESELLAEFCEEMQLTDRPESYVGSEEHVEDANVLAEVAPTDVREQVKIYRDFLAGGGVDPDDPDSNMTSNWPPEVQTAIDEIKAFVETNC